MDKQALAGRNAFRSLSRAVEPQSTSLTTNPEETRAASLLACVCETIESNPEVAHAAAVRLVKLLEAPPSRRQAPARGGLAPWQERKIDIYLRGHLSTQVRIEDLAAHVSVSVSHFSRSFKETYGTTPHLHIIRLRLELAQQFMISTTYLLSQIAWDCGLADQAHLSKLFRREMGETPSSWRRRNRTG